MLLCCYIARYFDLFNGNIVFCTVVTYSTPQDKAMNQLRQLYKPFLPYGKQYLGRAEYRAVLRTLKSCFLTQGPAVEQFENALKKVTGAPYAVAVTNGTMALQLAVQAVKILYKLPDTALGLTSPNTFVASANAMLYNQLAPIFCDISPDSHNFCLTHAEKLLQQYNKQCTNVRNQARKIELLLPVHFAGQPVDMQQVWQLAHNYGIGGNKRLPIIEDAAHALGSYYEQQGQSLEKQQQNNDTENNTAMPAVGSCVYSDACCFSFHPVKTITTAEGGAITCRDPALYQILLQLRSHGITRSASLWQNLAENCEESSQGPRGSQPLHSSQGAHSSQGLHPLQGGRPTLGPLWYYEMQYLGHNARLSDVHAALGIAQLQQLKSFAYKRRKIAKSYTNALQALEWLRTPHLGRHCCPHIYVVQINFARLGQSRNVVMQKLCKQGIGTQVHYIPLPMQPYYQSLGYTMNRLEQTAKYYSQALSLPLYPSLRSWQQRRVIKAIYALAK